MLFDSKSLWDIRPEGFLKDAKEKAETGSESKANENE